MGYLCTIFVFFAFININGFIREQNKYQLTRVIGMAEKCELCRSQWGSLGCQIIILMKHRFESKSLK